MSSADIYDENTTREKNIRQLEKEGISLDDYPDIIDYDEEVHPRGTSSHLTTIEKYPYGRVDSTGKMILKAMWSHGTNRYDYNESDFGGKLTPTTFICAVHGKFSQSPQTHLSGSGCKKCFIDRETKPVNEWVDSFREVHGDRYDYSLIQSRITSKEKVPIYCYDHDHIFYMIPDAHLKGSNCPKCSKKHRRTREEWREEIERVFKDQPWLDFSQTDFHRVNSNVSFFCKRHDKEVTKSAAYLLGGSGCPECDNEIQMELNRLKRVEEIKSDYFDYDNFIYDVDNVYDKNHPIWITCKKHQVSFKSTPYSHWYSPKKNCPVCGRESVIENLIYDTDKFIEMSKDVHGDNTFDYSKTEYFRSSKPVILICKHDGWEFELTPNSHLSKKTGCPKCSGKIRWTTDKWIQYAADRREGEGFDYSLVDYKGAFVPVKIKCKYGHVFEQTPDNHINGMKGCTYCQTPSMYYGSHYDENTEGVLYILRFSNEDESFIKVGISKNLKSRFRNKSYKRYDIEKVFVTGQEKMSDLVTLEQSILSELRHEGYRYNPSGSFAGSTECFVEECLGSEMLKDII